MSELEYKVMLEPSICSPCIVCGEPVKEINSIICDKCKEAVKFVKTYQTEILEIILKNRGE